MDYPPIAPGLARFAAQLQFEGIPPRVVDKTRLQALSVLGASFAGARSGVCAKILATAREWSGVVGPAIVIGHRDRLPLHHALYVNCAFSIVHDFDDYLFAGHTGHSAILPALAWAEKLSASGRDMIAAAVAANEVGGRLGAAFLLGPQNGQMWSYIHLLEAACVAGRFLGLGAEALNDAIGIAFTQPPYALIPAFFGPDSKATLAATPVVAGTQAAELAAHGLSGAPDILGGRDGFISRVAARPLLFVFSGYGGAWQTDSLCFKLCPGCAYIDTAVDALDAIEAERGARFTPGEIAEIRCASNYLTFGMELLSIRYGDRKRLSPITVNFSVALSLALKITAGGLEAEFLEHDYLARNRDAICALADRIKVEHDPAMTSRMSGLDSVGIDLRRYLDANPAEQASAALPDPLRDALGESSEPGSGGYAPTLEGMSFENYLMAFPVELTVCTRDGKRYVKIAEQPMGGAGRPLEETRALVREKFMRNAIPSIGASRAHAAADMIERLDQLADVRELTELLRT